MDCLFRDDCSDFLIVKLNDLLATKTDQRLARMSVLGLITTDISVQRFNFMCQAMLQQKIQRSINRRRLRIIFSLTQSMEKYISGNRDVLDPLGPTLDPGPGQWFFLCTQCMMTYCRVLIVPDKKF